MAVSTSHGVVTATPVTGDTVNNHYMQNSGKEKFHAKNTNASATARTVTILVAKTIDGQAVTSVTQAIPAGATWVFGPFPVDVYGTQVLVNVDHAELTLAGVA